MNANIELQINANTQEEIGQIGYSRKPIQFYLFIIIINYILFINNNRQLSPRLTYIRMIGSEKYGEGKNGLMI